MACISRTTAGEDAAIPPDAIGSDGAGVPASEPLLSASGTEPATVPPHCVLVTVLVEKEEEVAKLQVALEEQAALHAAALVATGQRERALQAALDAKTEEARTAKVWCSCVYVVTNDRGRARNRLWESTRKPTQTWH